MSHSTKNTRQQEDAAWGAFISSYPQGVDSSENYPRKEEPKRRKPKTGGAFGKRKA